MKAIEWTREKRDAFRSAYERANANKEHVFTFEGHEFFTGYAMYLLQYLNQRLDDAEE
jgi:hypothetical protein